MSWHFLQEQEEASWEASCLDGAPYALLSLMPTAAGCCSPDSGTDSCRDSRSGTMSAPLTAGRGGGGWTLSAGVFPAPTSALPKQTPRASTERQVAFGQKCGELFARLDQSTFTWKTVQPLLFEDLAGFSQTWPAWGLMRDGECLELSMPGCLTKEPASGLLPTPRTSVHKQRKFYIRKIYKANLEELPMLPAYSHLAGKQINPEWMEWMMGWPIGWADLKPLATDKFQQWLRSHGVCSEGQTPIVEKCDDL